MTEAASPPQPPPAQAAELLAALPDATCYLVGGAVRDQLLGLPVGERDWVVTGASPEQLTGLGFRQVGADFPVFIHPESGEEYALARTERKQGHGYHGFRVAFGPEVTLEQDLERRDLTINAMAQAMDGRLVDPWGGLDDLKARRLRHVSGAFVEDPLRVLRVARFAARFHGLGFTVSPKTLALMREVTESGELQHLVAERVWTELVKALASGEPQRFVRVLRDCGALAVVFPEIDALYGVPQTERYHPEVDTGVHLELVLAQTALLGFDNEVRFAALVHDLGKGITPKDQLPSHIGHENSGVPLVEALCERLRAPKIYRELAVLVCRHHLRCHRCMEMKPATLLRLLGDLDGLRRPERLAQFTQACEADYRGREGLSERPYKQADYLLAAHQVMAGVPVQELVREGLKGQALADALKARRLAALEQFVIDQRH